MTKLIAGSQIGLWHLTKISGDREIRELFREAQIELEDIFRLRARKTPFKPLHFPFIFIFMDSPYMFETAYNLLWGPSFTEVTGQELIDVLEFQDRKTVLEIALQVTVGDKIKELTFDKEGNIVAS